MLFIAIFLPAAGATQAKKHAQIAARNGTCKKNTHRNIWHLS